MSLTAIGIGPGDPELITVKGLKALQKADVVYYPASKLTETEENSFSRKIIDAYDLKCPCKPILFPMTGKGRDEFYREAYETLKNESVDKDVVIVNEGDLLFYSTYGYIQKLANQDKLECNLIPGIPAFVAASSVMKESLVDGNTSLQVMAKPNSIEEVKAALEKDISLVVMKAKFVKGWYPFLKELKRPFFYVEKVGTPEEYFTFDAEDLKDREIPYFATILFY